MRGLFANLSARRFRSPARRIQPVTPRVGLHVGREDGLVVAELVRLLQSLLAADAALVVDGGSIDVERAGHHDLAAAELCGVGGATVPVPLGIVGGAFDLDEDGVDGGETCADEAYPCLGVSEDRVSVWHRPIRWMG